MTIRIEGIEGNHTDRSNVALEMDQDIVSTIHIIAGLVENILVLSIHITPINMIVFNTFNTYCHIRCIPYDNTY